MCHNPLKLFATSYSDIFWNRLCNKEEARIIPSGCQLSRLLDNSGNNETHIQA